MNNRTKKSSNTNMWSVREKSASSFHIEQRRKPAQTSSVWEFDSEKDIGDTVKYAWNTLYCK